MGPSGCGKTVFTTKLLLDNLDLFETPPTKIYYCYKAWQEGFRPMKKQRQISRGHARFRTFTRVVSQGWITGLG